MPSRIISPFGTVSLFSGEHDSLLEQVFGQASERGQKPEDTVLSVDIFEDENRYVIWADLPGVDRSDIQLSCSDNVLTIAAETGRRFLKVMVTGCGVNGAQVIWCALSILGTC